jgi:hypothetical protein
MSEPSRWGPPGYDVASSPTVPLPTASRPNALRPTAAHPTTSRPAPAHPTRQLPAPAARDDYGAAGNYREADYGDDDHDSYRDDHRGSRPSPRPPDRPRSRGQVFAGLVLVLALVASGLLGLLTYQMLVSVDLISENPLGGLAGQATTLGAVAFGALVVFVLAVIAIAVARPKALAAMALAASLLLPVGAVALGVYYGGAVLRQNVESDLASAQGDIAADGAAAARTVLEELRRNGVDPGPLGDLLIQIAGG